MTEPLTDAELELVLVGYERLSAAGFPASPEVVLHLIATIRAEDECRDAAALAGTEATR